jgi:hypothetical protein
MGQQISDSAKSYELALEIMFDWMDPMDMEEWVRVNEINGWLREAA